MLCCRFQVDPRLDLLAELLPGLADIYRAWQNSTWVEEAGCFYSGDTEDAQQNSISGNGCRVLRNSIMVLRWPLVSHLLTEAAMWEV